MYRHYIGDECKGKDNAREEAVVFSSIKKDGRAEKSKKTKRGLL